MAKEHCKFTHFNVNLKYCSFATFSCNTSTCISDIYIRIRFVTININICCLKIILTVNSFKNTKGETVTC